MSDQGTVREAAPDSFSADTSPTNQFGERRFVEKLRWFGPVNMLMVLGAAIPTAGVSGLISYGFTAQLSESAANAAIGWANVVSALAGAIAAVLAGNLSDHTRTRIGRRNPWIIGGTVLAAASTLALIFVPFSHEWTVIALFSVFQIGLNTTLASYTALLPDRIASGLMGRASAWASFGTLLGTALGGIVVSVLVNTFGVANLSLGFTVLPWSMVIMSVIVVVAIPGAKLSRTPDTPRLDLRTLAATLSPSKDREFWFAFIGRLVFMIGLMLLVQTQTQQLRYYFGLSVTQAASMGAILSLLLAVFAMIASLISGPLSDRLGRRKSFVMVAAVIFAIGALVLLASNQPVVLYINVALAAFAFGVYSSVDQALMVEILPNQETAARDLGFLGTTNTLSGVIAGGIGALIIGTLGYHALFIIAAVCALVSIVFFIPIRRVR